MKKKEKKKEEMPTWKGHCGPLIPCDMSYNAQKKFLWPVL